MEMFCWPMCSPKFIRPPRIPLRGKRNATRERPQDELSPAGVQRGPDGLFRVSAPEDVRDDAVGVFRERLRVKLFERRNLRGTSVPFEPGFANDRTDPA